MQQAKLNRVSGNLVSPMCWYTPFQVEMKVSALNLSPSRPLICEEAIVIEAADVKPDTTGNDTNSTKNPVSIKIYLLLIVYYFYLTLVSFR